MYGDFRQEVWLMSGLIHPNVVSLLGYCTEPYAMVMDFVSCGDLYTPPPLSLPSRAY